jgi:ribulose-phosphate 3-epimerase
MAAIYPSLIGADLLNLEKTISLLDPFCAGYHLDVMDHHFVPNLSMGPMFINALAKKTQRTDLWVHLMVTDPTPYIDKLQLPPGSYFTFHIESKGGVLDVIKHIREKKWKPGIAIKPKTPVQEIFPFLNLIDQLTVMSVEPGFAGQQFLKESIEKVKTVAAYRATSKTNFALAIDGGINQHNIKELAQLGVDQFAVSTAIFDHHDPVAALKLLHALIK